MEAWQSGLMRAPAKGVDVKVSEVRILPLPLWQQLEPLVQALEQLVGLLV